MTRAWQRALAVGVATVGSTLSGALADRWASAPTANVLRGTEEAFAEGLHWRELRPPEAPVRWTKPIAKVTFRNLPTGRAVAEIAVRAHQTPVLVTANGLRVTEIQPGKRGGTYDVGLLTAPTLEILLQTRGFIASSGRPLGTQLLRVSLHHSPTRRPHLSILGLFAALGCLFAVLVLAAGVGSIAASVVGWGISALLAASVMPYGLIRSGYVTELAHLLASVGLLACAGAWLAERRVVGAGRWAFGAILVASLIQGVAAVSPVMVTSDAYFHANNLVQVSRGELFLTSTTPHEPPFRIPYGTSFYVLLLPFLFGGIDPVALVRWGAAISGVVASCALFSLLLTRSAQLAGLTVVMLQLLPESFRYYSEATLSNVFGQSATVWFFVWWAAGGPLGPGVGAALLAIGCLAHLSSLLVLALSCGALLVLRRRTPALSARLDWAVSLGLALAAAYYANFVRLFLDQAPRVLEGAGGAGGPVAGLRSALANQLGQMVGGWGFPALLLAWIGRPRHLADPIDRALVASWLAGLTLFALATVSPLEARYVYALTLPVAVAAAGGLMTLWKAGRLGRTAALTLVSFQTALAMDRIIEALGFKYRP